MRITTSVLCVVLLCIVTSASSGADWPQYRHDPGRSGATAETLPARLHQMWVRQLPTPRPTFPTELRLAFDATYEPVVMGKKMFVPSMVTDSVTALETDTGEQSWKFFTEGPVRLAPVAADGRVYFVSDDGHLYCVSAEDGRLLWKFNGTPKDRPSRRLMGNGRLISVVPARGGPVLHNGVIYFAAGIWSGEGVYVHALNAKTGKPVWSNTESHHIEAANADHAIATYAGISPQGHLAIVDNTLIVPCGAQLPALFDLKTGKIRTYTIGWGGRVGLPKGFAFVSGVGKYLMHGGDLYDMGQSAEAPSLNTKTIKFDLERMIHPGALTRLQVERNNQKFLQHFRQPVLTPDAMYYQEGGIVACDLTKPDIRKRADANIPPHRREDHTPDPLVADFPVLWNMASNAKVHIKAGNRLYLGRPGVVEAIDIPAAGEKPQIKWSTTIEGTPHRMLAADGKLFVVTLEGSIYAFGGKHPEKPLVHKLPDHQVPATEKKNIIEDTGIREGYAVILGLKDGLLAQGIAQGTLCDIIVIDDDAEKIDALRRDWDEQQLYGKRISIFHGDPLTFELPPLMASLITSEDADFTAKAGKPETIRRLYRSLRPYGGTLCFELSDGTEKELPAKMPVEDLVGCTVVRKDGRVLFSRNGPLPKTGSWSHYGANAANTGASKDRLLRAPLKRLWFDSRFRWHRKPGKTEVRIAGGRIVIKSDKLYAMDVFTGRNLWQVDSPPSEGDLIATADAIYNLHGNTCHVHDPATGKKIREITYPGDPNGRWGLVRVENDIMVSGGNNTVLCLDRKTGKVLWRHQCDAHIKSLAVGDGKVFAISNDNARRRRADIKPGTPSGMAVALDAKTGRLLWKTAGDGEVRYSQGHNLLVVGKDVLKASDGTKVWSGVPASQTFVIADKLVTFESKNPVTKLSGIAIRDLATGDPKGKDVQWYRRGCTSLRASENLLTTRYLGNAAIVDLLENGQITSIWNVRAACSNNLFPGDGVLNIPNLSGGCTCNYMPISQGLIPFSDLSVTKGGKE